MISFSRMKIFCLSLTFIMMCQGMYAQIIYPNLGLTASVNTNRPPYYDIKPRLSFMLGVGYNQSFSKMISGQVELNYVQKAFQSDYAESAFIQYGEDLYEVHETRTNRYRISYLELPLLLKVKLFHEDFFVCAGPSLGFAFGGSHKYVLDRNSSYLGELHEEGTGKIKFGDPSLTTTKDVYFDNRWDIGINVGVGALVFKKLLIACRFTQGTINLNKHVDSKNRCLQISLATPIQLR